MRGLPDLRLRHSPHAADTGLGGLDIEIVSRIGAPVRGLTRATAERRADALVIGVFRRLTRAR